MRLIRVNYTSPAYILNITTAMFPVVCPASSAGRTICFNHQRPEWGFPALIPLPGPDIVIISWTAECDIGQLVLIEELLHWSARLTPDSRGRPQMLYVCVCGLVCRDDDDLVCQVILVAAAAAWSTAVSSYTLDLVMQQALTGCGGQQCY